MSDQTDLRDHIANVDFWAARIAAVIRLAEHYGMTVDITGGELAVSRPVSDALIARTEVRWRAESPAAEAQQQPDTETWDLPDARPDTTDHTLTRQAATVDPAVCPRCKGDNREAFALCPDCTEADGRLLCPRCREDITDYAEDDRVWRTGDDRPYCSMECVIAAHRAGLPTAAMEGAAAADTSEEEHRG